MKYNFDEVHDRIGSNSVKWDERPDVIPMWVADMDFKAAPFIIDAVRRRVDHGIFGYTHVPESYYDSVIRWFRERRGWTIDRSWIQYISGIVPALSVAVQALTEQGDKVLIHAPAYNCFYSSVRNIGRELVESRLVRKGDSFEVDFADFENKCADPDVKLFILCNPQNPAGRVWTREELVRMGDICLKHGVTVVSDEIHCELEMPGHTYTPFASISKEFEMNSVIFNSPTKSFNIAGLEIANIIAADKEKYDRIERVINIFEHCDVNPLGVEALQAAYTEEGAEWLRQLNAYLVSNYNTLKIMLDDMPQVKVCRLEGTYLVWVDCSWFTSRGTSTKRIQDSLLENEKVWINSGTMYGDGDYMRINIACPHITLVEGLSRAKAGLKRIVSEMS